MGLAHTWLSIAQEDKAASTRARDGGPDARSLSGEV